MKPIIGLTLALLFPAAEIGCARKPATAPAVKVFSNCGPLPPAVRLTCSAVLNADGTLKPGKTPSDFAACIVDDYDAVLTANDQLRAQYAACSK